MSDEDQGPVYDDEFYEDMGDLAQHAAVELVPLLMELVEPKSVIDVGCGAGAFVHEFVRLGVTDVLGVDGPHFAAAHYRGPEDTLLVLDLEQPTELDRRFDLVLCLEVAEHLPYARSGGFVRDLARLADVIVFSAAIPGQGGTHHVNEQWPTFWRDQFARHGFEAYDALRPLVWNNPSVARWYKQNVVVYARPGAAPDRLASASAPLLSLVHPDQYELLLAEVSALEHAVRTLRDERDVAAGEREAAQHEAHRLEENVAELAHVHDERHRLSEEVERLRSLLAAAQLLASHGPAGGASRRAVPPPMDRRERGRRLLLRPFAGLARRLPGFTRPSGEPAPTAEPFDPAWYLSVNPDVAALGDDPIRHYTEVGWREHRRPHPLFDTAWYLATNPDVAAVDVDPLHHYATTGWRERRNPHPLFDTAWYLSTYPDAAASGLNPLAHFDQHGWRDGRNPHPLFDTSWYLATNPDVAEAGLNPLSHFVLHGVFEGRPPAPHVG